MYGLVTAAIVATLLGSAVCGCLIWQIAERKDRLLLALLFLLALPLSAGTYYLVRLPLKGAIDARLDKDAPANIAAKLCYAPVTEEPAKLLPLLILLLPVFRGRLTRENLWRWPWRWGSGLRLAKCG